MKEFELKAKGKNKMKEFELKAKGKTVEIWIYEDIGDTWIGGLSAKQFADELKAAGAVNEINIYLNSSGGSVMDGLAIYNTLKRHKAHKTVDIDGFAVSIASLVAMAGDTIRMAENGMFMIHDPWIVTSGTADDLRTQAQAMDKIKDGLAETYHKKAVSTLDEIKDMMSAETWLSAAEALDLGFIDEITAEQKMAAHFDLSKFKNAPGSLTQIIKMKNLATTKTKPAEKFDTIEAWKKRIKQR